MSRFSVRIAVFLCHGPLFALTKKISQLSLFEDRLVNTKRQCCVTSWPSQTNFQFTLFNSDSEELSNLLCCETNQFHCKRTKQTGKSTRDWTTIYYNAQPRRDCNPPTYASSKVCNKQFTSDITASLFYSTAKSAPIVDAWASTRLSDTFLSFWWWHEILFCVERLAFLAGNDRHFFAKYFIKTWLYSKPLCLPWCMLSIILYMQVKG